MLIFFFFKCVAPCASVAAAAGNGGLTMKKKPRSKTQRSRRFLSHIRFNLEINIWTETPISVTSTRAWSLLIIGSMWEMKRLAKHNNGNMGSSSDVAEGRVPISNMAQVPVPFTSVVPNLNSSGKRRSREMVGYWFGHLSKSKQRRWRTSSF